MLQYIKAQKKESLGELGWVQVVIALLPIVISLVGQGYSYYSALKTAKQMQKNQRLFTEIENRDLAQALVQQYPQLTFDEALNLVNATNLIYPPINNDETKENTSYWTYLAIFVIVLVVTKK